MAECLKHNMKVIIDLKSWESPDETINLVTSLYKQMPALRTSALVTSFFPQLLYKLRSSDIIVCEEKTSMLRSADPDIIVINFNVATNSGYSNTFKCFEKF